MYVGTAFNNKLMQTSSFIQMQLQTDF